MIPARIFPDEEDFENHMCSTRRLSNLDNGRCRNGLCDRLLLDENMLSPILRDAYRRMDLQSIPGRHPLGPKRWHGAPMAAINQGFLVTGAARMRLPEKELQELQLIYSKEPSMSHSVTAADDNDGQQTRHDVERASRDANEPCQVLYNDGADETETSLHEVPLLRIDSRISVIRIIHKEQRR